MDLSEPLVHTRIRRLVVNPERRDCHESTAVRDEHPAVKTLSFSTFVIPFFYSFLFDPALCIFIPPSSYFSSKMLCPRCVSAGFDIQQLPRCVCVCVISEVCTSLPSG